MLYTCSLATSCSRLSSTFQFLFQVVTIIITLFTNFNITAVSVSKFEVFSCLLINVLLSLLLSMY